MPYWSLIFSAAGVLPSASAEKQQQGLLQANLFESEGCTTHEITMPTKYNAKRDRLLLFASPKTASSTLRQFFRTPFVYEDGARCKSVEVGQQNKDGKVGTCDSLLSAQKAKVHTTELAKQFLEQSRGSTTFVLVPVRQGLTRAMSNFFQVKYPFGGDIVGNETAPSLLAEFWKNWQPAWSYGKKFVSGYEDALGVKLTQFAQTVNFTKNHGMFLETSCPRSFGRKQKVVTILLRVEDSSTWRSTLLQHFDESDIFLKADPKANTGEDKPYAALYHNVKGLFKTGTNQASCMDFVGADEQSIFYSATELSDTMKKICGTLTKQVKVNLLASSAGL